MGSWKVHKVIGETLLGYYNHEIDKIIDSTPRHDSSRYDIKELAKLVELVKNRFGTKDLYYMVLHHYIDRLVSLLISEICYLFDMYYSQDIFRRELLKFKDKILKRLFLDPSNILNVFVQEYREILHHLLIDLAGRVDSRKKHKMIKRLDETYEALKDYPELKEELGSIIDAVRSSIRRKLRFIIKVIISEEEIFRKVWQYKIENTFRYLPERMIEIKKIKSEFEAFKEEFKNELLKESQD